MAHVYLAAHAPCLTAFPDISSRQDEHTSPLEERYIDIDTPAPPLDFAIDFVPEYPPPILEHYDDTTMGDQGNIPLLNADDKCFKSIS